jgi:hypothetical protein
MIVAESWRSVMTINKCVSSDPGSALVRTQSPQRVGCRLDVLLVFHEALHPEELLPLSLFEHCFVWLAEF